MKVEIVCKNDRRACAMAGELRANLQARGVEVELLNSDGLPEIVSRPAADLVFVLGGDGTLLQTARLFACAGTPIVGVNLGAVGFLSSVEPGDLQPYLDELLRQEYDLDARFMIAATVTREQQVLYRGIALNDVVLRSRVPHTILVTLKVDGRPCTTYQADGLVCATPTGSTAYSFSAGGPVIDAGLEALVITPICPHLSSSRSLVVSASSRLSFELNSDYSTDISVDGQEEMLLAKGDQVQIEKSELVANLVRLKQVSRLEKIKHLRGRQHADSSTGRNGANGG